MSKFALLIVALFVSVNVASAKHHHNDSTGGWEGSWQMSDGSSTISISLNGNNAIINYSNGSPDSGTVDGNTISYQGVSKQNGQLYKTTGTLELSADGNSIIKRQAVYYPNGIKTNGFTYIRQSSSPSVSFSSSSSSSSSSVAGIWQADNNPGQVLTITVNGRDAVMNYSIGTPDSGTIRNGRIEFQGVARRDVNGQRVNLKTTGTIETTSNGRTLLVRQAVNYSNGDIKTETRTYTRIR
jgi:hypothetical protein